VLFLLLLRSAKAAHVLFGACICFIVEVCAGSVSYKCSTFAPCILSNDPCRLVMTARSECGSW
jgi:hypothetical protein